MLLHQKIQTVMVAYNSMSWIVYAIRSYQQLFPSEIILVVDNNHDQNCQESVWLKNEKRLIVITGADKSHGGGMDTAMEWCHHNNAGIMIHIEPDTLCKTTEWKSQLIDAVLPRWMVGAYRKTYGPIHPTPSAWKIRPWKTFRHIRKTAIEKNDPKYSELVDDIPDDNGWFNDWWDTAHLNWFLAEREGKTALLNESEIFGKHFMHYWAASRSSPKNDFVNQLIEPMKTFFRLKDYNHILVTGPARSGTTFTTFALANDLDMPFLDETYINHTDHRLLPALQEKYPRFVLQCQGISHACEAFADDQTAVVFCIRPRDEIIASQERINWTWEKDALAKYGITDQNKRAVDIAYEKWNHQKEIISKNAFEINYHDLEFHPLWIQDRSTFDTKQVENGLYQPKLRLC